MNDKAVADVCKNKWPRLLPVTWAAGYCGMNLNRFKSVPDLVALIRDYAGKEMVDKNDLDLWIEETKNSQRAGA
jgi:hypothetical protein